MVQEGRRDSGCGSQQGHRSPRVAFGSPSIKTPSPHSRARRSSPTNAFSVTSFYTSWSASSPPFTSSAHLLHPSSLALSSAPRLRLPTTSRISPTISRASVQPSTTSTLSPAPWYVFHVFCLTPGDQPSFAQSFSASVQTLTTGLALYTKDVVVRYLFLARAPQNTNILCHPGC